MSAPSDAPADASSTPPPMSAPPPAEGLLADFGDTSAPPPEAPPSALPGLVDLSNDSSHTLPASHPATLRPADPFGLDVEKTEDALSPDAPVADGQSAAPVAPTHDDDAVAEGLMPGKREHLRSTSLESPGEKSLGRDAHGSLGEHTPVSLDQAEEVNDGQSVSVSAPLARADSSSVNVDEGIDASEEVLPAASADGSATMPTEATVADAEAPASPQAEIPGEEPTPPVQEGIAEDAEPYKEKSAAVIEQTASPAEVVPAAKKIISAGTVEEATSSSESAEASGEQTRADELTTASELNDATQHLSDSSTRAAPPALSSQDALTPAEAPAFHLADAPVKKSESDDPVDNGNAIGESPTSPPRARPPLANSDASRTLPRSTSNGSVTSLSTGRNSVSHLTRGSMVFVVNALETIDKSKEARKSEALKKACERALELVRIASASAAASTNNLSSLGRSETVLEPRTVMEPLRIACGTGNPTLVPIAIDCISKLVGFSFFAEEDPFETARNRAHDGRSTPPPAALADLVTETVCNAFTEMADDRTQLQIIKALLAIVLSNTSHVHQGSLIKAVRTVYNIFLLSRNPANQAVAQASLTQMVHHVFSRIPLGDQATSVSAEPSLGQETPQDAAKDEKPPEGEDDSVAPVEEQEPMTLQALERRKSFQGASEKDTAATLSGVSARELFVKDAFLILRTLCKLSMKPLTADMERDPKSQGMRSKILSLHLIYVIIKKHLAVFADPNVVITSTSTGEHTSFIYAVKQYICLSLSRNAVSSVNQIFELAVEIFWLVMDGLRAFLKKEIEVLLNEIFLPILEMRTATATQKSILLSVLNRLCRSPQALVEVYINYDCDRSALENIYERLVNIISRISQTQLGPTLSAPEPLPLTALQRGDEPGLAALAPQHHPVDAPEDEALPVEMHLKRQSLECLVAVLHSLVQWASRGTLEDDDSAQSPRASLDSTTVTPVELRSDSPSQHTTNPSLSSLVDKTLQDDPLRFESAKARKNVLLEGIRLFNEKPKRGVTFLVENGFIRSSEPKDIAPFLLYADGLNKAQVGEYLGEGDVANIATMHAFVDLMNFKGLHFLAALRRFLQAFRLPGEAQKIDRFMLKFAERYVMGNPGVFATADTAYVFAYSIIMLNTDAHNPQVKHRMSLQDFIRNNQGIDDGNSLSEDYQRQVYESIVTNEIKMKDEMHAVVPPPAAIAGFIAGVGRDQNRAAYDLQSEGMANKTEALFRTMVRARRRVGPEQRAAVERFFSASHMDHVKPMFEVAWMPILAGISGPMQETSDMNIVQLCLAAFKDAIHISCLFDLELERDAFVTTLAKFTFLNNLAEMKAKHVEAIKCLLGIAQAEGNYLKGSWRELLMCVSQLERFQLISGGVDERQLPDLGRRRIATPSSNSTSGNSLTRSLFSATSTEPKPARLPTVDVVQAGASAEVTVAADKVFSQTPQLSGTAIVDFVESLCAVSWEEIQSSGMSDSPRLFSLQKLVEISYYNMNRIRMEWSQIWAILGEHFNNVLVTNQLAVSTFAVDSLRQLAMKFLEKEELPGFAFQKDFLRPFSYAMRHSPEIETREMIIDCLWQGVQARSANMRSGWASIFLILSAAAQDSSGTFAIRLTGFADPITTEKVTLQAFELVQGLFESHFVDILLHSFSDFTSCLAAFSQSRAQRVSLQAIGVLRSVIPAMQRLVKSADGEVVERLTGLDAQPVYWYAILAAFFEIVMKGADLEVRRVALDSLFDIVSKHGTGFTSEFWDKSMHGIVFAIFGVLDGQHSSAQEDTTVWLSTTMIQALRNLIDLWSAYFDTLSPYFPELLDLLETCICQENDTIARIGTNSLQLLLQNNVAHFSETQWEQIVETIMRLFEATTANQLFDPMLIATSSSPSGLPTAEEDDDAGALPRRLGAEGASTLRRPLTTSERRKVFKQIIMRCVLQLLLIETVNELLHDAEFYERIPPAQLLRLLQALQDGYTFAKRFNADKDLRVTLWRLGFMRQLPNLLRQESTAASTLVSLLLHMMRDNRPAHLATRSEVLGRFVPLGEEIAGHFLALDVETQSRNIAAWMPVVAEIFTGVAELRDEEEAPKDRDSVDDALHTFSYFAPRFYPLAVELVTKSGLSAEVLLSLRGFFYKAGLVSGLCPLAPVPGTPAPVEDGPAPLSPVMESREPSPSPRRQLSMAAPLAETEQPVPEASNTTVLELEDEVAEPPLPLAATQPALSAEPDSFSSPIAASDPDASFGPPVEVEREAEMIPIPTDRYPQEKAISLPVEAKATDALVHRASRDDNEPEPEPEAQDSFARWSDEAQPAQNSDVPEDPPPAQPQQELEDRRSEEKEELIELEL